MCSRHSNKMSNFVICVVFMCLGCVSAMIKDASHFSIKSEELVMFRNVTPLCLSHTQHWTSELQRGVPWALNMLDSYTKLPTGYLEGSTNHLGNFDQCLEVSVLDELVEFQGQYCRASIDIDIPGQLIITSNMMYAFCFPSTCSEEDIPILIQDYIAPALGIGIKVKSFNPNDCYKDEPALLQPETLIFIIFTCLILGLEVICAMVERKLGEKTPSLVRACSLTSSCRSLFDTRKHPSDISCLHGLRVGSMLWIIIGHRYDQERWLPLSNPTFKDTYFNNPLKMTVVNAMPSVDTFFLLSGLLMCTSILREVHRSPFFDVIKFYVYRFFRLVMPIAILIALYITVMPVIGSGPLWKNYFPIESRNCKVNWWTNIIFVNNYIEKDGFRMCLGQTWYTAVDMQLAWLSPLVLLPLYHSRRAGLQLMTLLILISCFIPFAVTYIFKFPPTNMMKQLDIDLTGVPEGNFSLQIYNATQSRATPYLCGILFGYYIFKTNMQKDKIILSENYVRLGWILCSCVALTVIYALDVFYAENYEYSVVGSSFYAGFHRLGWSIAIIWMIFACINGYGGIIEIILSWRLLLPLSRLTYCAFLLHMITMMYDSATKRTQSHFSDYDAVHGYFGDIASVYVFAFVLYVIIEAPVLSSLKIVFGKGKSSKVKEKL